MVSPWGRRFRLHPRAAEVPLAVRVPVAELLIALLLAVPTTVTSGFVLAMLFCCGLTAVPVLVLVRGKTVKCACFGASEVPMGGWHVARNAVLLAAAGLGTLVALRLGDGVPAHAPSSAYLRTPSGQLGWSAHLLRVDAQLAGTITAARAVAGSGPTALV
ncbi:MauE/DoxX family redox-associated membrane protein [Streptomyces milbemycinicus]|uniref:MauE/DoxX family redox-associated membrane protein n=1 Tax=Streptomyces milbemycinicus TaxID=476552 RepID=UPI0033EBF239